MQVRRISASGNWPFISLTNPQVTLRFVTFHLSTWNARPLCHGVCMSLPLKSSLHRYAASNNSVSPRHLGTRYDADGTFLPEPGNTVVCHLVGGSSSEHAILEVRRRMMSMPDANKLTFTPVSSLHMTLFQGIIEYRRALPYWPEDLSLDTSIDDMTQLYLKRFETFEDRGSFNIKVDWYHPRWSDRRGSYRRRHGHQSRNGETPCPCHLGTVTRITTHMSFTLRSPTRRLVGRRAAPCVAGTVCQ